MTIRTFWIIFLRILGICLVLSSMTVLASMVSVAYLSCSEENKISFIFAVIQLLISIGIYVLIINVFILKTEWLLDILSLDKGFAEDRIDLNIKFSTILIVATIVIGGVMFVDSLPKLFSQVFVFYQQKNIFRKDPNAGWIILYLFKSILGFLLMSNSRQIAGYVHKHTSEDDECNQ